VDEASRAEVVKEALDVEEDCGGNTVRGNARVDEVVQVARAINCTAKVPAAKLERGKDVKSVEVGHDSFGDDLFKELANTLQETDGSVHFWGGVVGFVRLWDNDDPGRSPRVDTERKTGGEERGETRGRREESPLQQFIANAAGARC
jgi:hypothetical protein